MLPQGPQGAEEHTGQVYIHTQHSTGPACPLPALTQVPAHSPCHINTNCPHVPLSQQLLHRTATTQRGCWGRRQCGTCQIQMPSQAHCSEPNPGSCLLLRAGASSHWPLARAASSACPHSRGPIRGQVNELENINLML